MTNPNYYHQQNQEGAIRTTASQIVMKQEPQSQSQSVTLKIKTSPLHSTAPNSASSSPLSFCHNSTTNSNGNLGNNNTMTMGNNDNSGSVSAMNEDQFPQQQELEHRHYSSVANSNFLHNGPLSPQSAPPTTSVSAAPTSSTSVPSIIHTEEGIDGESAMTRERTYGSTPYFPSINRSSSGNMSTGSSSSTSNLVAKRTATKVTGKKKHQTSKQKSGGNNNTILAQATGSPRPHDAGGAPVTNGQKKQRRLERNRLSAQLSRRRRKQYLEELEDRVVRLSLDMDSGRRAHAFRAIDRISEMRQQVLASGEAMARELEGIRYFDTDPKAKMLRFQLENSCRLLENTGPLSRTNSGELLILNSFLGQQLKSFSLPSHAKFILWLSLQGDIYYRGGRAASERLSAARIGERMLASGTDKVEPSNAMWPLVCNEVGLSYELEERLRVYQRTTILQEKGTWLDRHTARSSALVMQSFHNSVGGMACMVGSRERTMTHDILTPAQRVKYLAWAGRNSNRIKARLKVRQERQAQQRREELKIQLEETDPNNVDIGTFVDKDYSLNKTHHLAANLYILNHQLQRILKTFPYHSPSILTAPILKKLMRRASFESLGQQKDEGRVMSREDSFTSSGSMKSHPSNGALMKSTSNPALSAGNGANDLERPAALNQITPQVGEQAAVEVVNQALGFVKPIIPPIPKPVNPVNSTVYAPAPVNNNAPGTVRSHDTVSAMAIDYHDFHNHHLVPAPAHSYGATAPLAPAPPSNHLVAPTPQYKAVPLHHYPTPAPPQLTTHNYSATHTPTHDSSQVQPANQNYQQLQQTEQHYYPRQQHVQYAPAPAVAAHGQPMTSIGQESIAPVYESSSSEPQHQHHHQAPQHQHSAHEHQQQRPPAGNSRHERKSSFLPSHLNSVPEDMFPGVEGTAADFIELQDYLMDGEDWGIGVGLDMDTSA